MQNGAYLTAGSREQAISSLHGKGVSTGGRGQHSNSLGGVAGSNPLVEGEQVPELCRSTRRDNVDGGEI